MSSSSSVRARAGVVALLVSILVVVGACTSGGAASPSAAPTQAPVASPSAAATASAAPTASPTPAAAFPVTLTDDEGTSFDITAEPEQIVSLTPAATETLFALGAGDRVVATDSGSDYPADAAALPDVATFEGVDVERIVDLGTDLVIAGGQGFNPAESIAQLRSLGIPVLVLYASTIDGVYDDIELVGKASGQAEEATELVDSMRTEMDAIGQAATAAGAEAAAKPRVFYDVGYTDGTGEIYGAAEGSYLAEMIGRLGVDPILGDATTWQVPLETLVERDPQVIVLGTNAFYQPTAETVAARNGWAGLSAVKNGDIRPVGDTEITRPGPRLPTGMRNLAQAMYPDLQLPAAP